MIVLLPTLKLERLPMIAIGGPTAKISDKKRKTTFLVIVACGGFWVVDMNDIRVKSGR